MRSLAREESEESPEESELKKLASVTAMRAPPLKFFCRSNRPLIFVPSNNENQFSFYSACFSQFLLTKRNELARIALNELPRYLAPFLPWNLPLWISWSGFVESSWSAFSDSKTSSSAPSWISRMSTGSS